MWFFDKPYLIFFMSLRGRHQMFEVLLIKLIIFRILGSLCLGADFNWEKLGIIFTFLHHQGYNTLWRKCFEYIYSFMQIIWLDFTDFHCNIIARIARMIQSVHPRCLFIIIVYSMESLDKFEWYVFILVVWKVLEIQLWVEWKWNQEQLF